MWCKHSFPGDIDIELDVDLRGNNLAVMLYQDEGNASHSISILPDRIELLENLKLIAHKNISPGEINAKQHISIKLTEDKLICNLNENKMIEENLKRPYLRVRPSFISQGGDFYINNVEIYTHPRSEYDFSIRINAAEDFSEWEEETPYWEISSSSKYSIYKGLGGIIKDREDETSYLSKLYKKFKKLVIKKDKESIIWNKQNLPSEKITLETRAGIFKLPREGGKEGKYKIGINICSNGKVKNGYRVIFGNDDIILYRNKTEVARSLSKDVQKGQWQWYKIQKANKLIRVYLSNDFGYDRLVLEYIDDNPLRGEKSGLQVVGTEGANVVFSPIYIY